MTKKIAVLPDLMGDEWDPFIMKMAAKISALAVNPTLQMVQLSLRSTLFTESISVVYWTRDGLPQTAIWVEGEGRKDIPVTAITQLIRGGWKESPRTSGMVAFSKEHPPASATTYIPRTITSALKLLGAVPKTAN